MSDARLRDLERRWRATGADEDKAAYLLERVRTGEMTGEQLFVAARCGLSAAMLVLPGIQEIITHDDAGDEHTWHEFFEISVNVSKRSSIAAVVECVLNPRKQHETYIPFTKRLVALSLRLMLDSTPTNREAVSTYRQGPRPQTTAYSYEMDAAYEFSSAASEMRAYYAPAMRSCRKGLGMSFRVTDAIKRDLIAWALGNDPLPALLARLEAEVAGTTPTTPPG